MISESLFVFPKETSEYELNFARQCAIKLKCDLCNSGIQTKEIVGDNANENEIVKELSTKHDGNFLMFGHGSPEAFTVHQDRKPIFFLRNAVHLKNLVCYFLSCCTGQKIGPAAMGNDALAFIGFKENFEFIPYYEHVFFECAISGIRKYLKGECAIHEIEKNTNDAFNAEISRLISQREYYAAQKLLLDLSVMVFLIRGQVS